MYKPKYVNSTENILWKECTILVMTKLGLYCTSYVSKLVSLLKYLKSIKFVNINTHLAKSILYITST